MIRIRAGTPDYWQQRPEPGPVAIREREFTLQRGNNPETFQRAHIAGHDGFTTNLIDRSRAATSLLPQAMETVMQPGSIKKFEIFYLAAWGVSLIATFLGWDTVAILESRVGRQLGFGIYTAIIIVGLLLPLALAYLAARRRSNVARWIIVGIFTLHALGVLRALFTAGFAPGVVGALGIIVFVLRAVAIRFLFGPEAREWFAGKRATSDVPAAGATD